MIRSTVITCLCRQVANASTSWPIAVGTAMLAREDCRVMALYGGGEPVKSVAYQLGISEETAKSYLKRIREKYRVAGFDVGTKVALRKRAIEDGILIESDIRKEL